MMAGGIRLTLLLPLVFGFCQARLDPDGRPMATLRMNATDAGIVLRHGPEPFDAIGARDVWVFADRGTYYMHYDAAGPSGWLCALATSDDAVHWHKHGVVMALGHAGTDDSHAAAYCTTYKAGADWHIFYLGARITTPAPERIPWIPYYTLKAKGAFPAGPWRKQYDVVPFRPVPGTFYAVEASPGFIVRRGDEYLQFFSGAQASEITPGQLTALLAGTLDPEVAMSTFRLFRTLGIARTRTLDGRWTVDPQPILPPAEQIENSSLYYEPANRTWFLFTNHIGATTAIWVYWTRDLVHWDPRHKAVVLDGENCRWSKSVHGLPSVLPVGQRLAIFYDGVLGDGNANVGRDVGLAWLDLPLVPPAPSGP